MTKILFLAANPTDTGFVRLDDEQRTIDIELQKSKERSKFLLLPKPAVRVDDLSIALLQVEPDIVHFSGHGSKGQIYLRDDSGRRQPVNANALSDLFSILHDNIRCVVLNSCYSKYQAVSIARHIDCVIGMSRPISDPAAIEFAKGFYRGLGGGKSLKTAFQLGCNQIALKGLNGQNTPQIIWKSNKPKRILFCEKHRQKKKGRLPRKLSWEIAEQAADEIAYKMNYESFDPTLIVGIGRGGAILGSLISERMAKKPLLAIDRKYKWDGNLKTDDLLLHFKLPKKFLERVLLVTGEVHTGKTLMLYRKYLSKIKAKNVRCASFYVQKNCRQEVDYIGVKASKGKLMPWITG